MSDIRIIEVKQSVFANNDADAQLLRQQLKAEKTFLLNLMSSPGAGKTTLLKAVLNRLKEMIYPVIDFSACEQDEIQHVGYDAAQCGREK